MFENRVALITGGADGIGYAIAQRRDSPSISVARAPFIEMP